MEILTMKISIGSMILLASCLTHVIRPETGGLFLGIGGSSLYLLYSWNILKQDWSKFSSLFVVCWFFSKTTFSKNYLSNIIWVSSRLNPDQVWHFVRPDLGPNCLQKLWADEWFFKNFCYYYNSISGLQILRVCDYYFYFSTQTYTVDIQRNYLNGTVLMSIIKKKFTYVDKWHIYRGL